MNDRRKKIDELQRLIEEKAKELGKVSSIVEELTKQRYSIGVSISAAEGDVKLLRKEKGRVEGEILAANERLVSALSPHKQKFETLEEAIVYLDSLVVIRRKDLEEVTVIKKEIEVLKTAKAQAHRAHEDILEKINAAFARLAQAVRDTEQEFEKQRKINAQIDGQKASMGVRQKNLDEWEERLKFYARRLNKLYVEKGIAFPQDLMEAFRPLKYFPSRDLQKKLELKRKLQKIYG